METSGPYGSGTRRSSPCASSWTQPRTRSWRSCHARSCGALPESVFGGGRPRGRRQGQRPTPAGASWSRRRSTRRANGNRLVASPRPSRAPEAEVVPQAEASAGFRLSRPACVRDVVRDRVGEKDTTIVEGVLHRHPRLHARLVHHGRRPASAPDLETAEPQRAVPVLRSRAETICSCRVARRMSGSCWTPGSVAGSSPEGLMTASQ